MPNWRDWNAGSCDSSSMIRAGSVPFWSSAYTSIWLACVPSTLAWQAATPLPGTTTACTPIRNASLLLTQVADAMTTRPVLMSTAMTDQVAKAVEGTRSDSAKNAAARRVERAQRQWVATRRSASAKK